MNSKLSANWDASFAQASAITHTRRKPPLQLSIFGFSAHIWHKKERKKPTRRHSRVIFFVMSPTLTFYYSCAFHSPTFSLRAVSMFIFLSCAFPQFFFREREMTEEFAEFLSWLTRDIDHLNLNEIKSIRKFHFLCLSSLPPCGRFIVNEAA